jgi:hypothetical protein
MNEHESRPTDRAAEGVATGLDPVTDPERWENLVARINQAAGPILERRRPASLSRTLSAWRRPVAWGSAGLVAAAAMALALLPTELSDPADEILLAEAVVPWTLAAWMEGEYSPTVMELVRSVDEYTP